MSQQLQSEGPGTATGSVRQCVGTDHSATQPSRVVLMPSGSAQANLPCSIVRFERGEIHVRADRRIPPSTSVSVGLDGVTVCGLVSYCTLEESGYCICITTTGGDDSRRSALRRPVNVPCAVIVPGEPDHGWREGRIVDYSWSGLGVKSPLNVQVGTTLCVKTDTMLTAGVVRHYRRCDDGWSHQGIEVTDVLFAEDRDPGNGRFIENVRHRFAEFILGRPIDNVKSFAPMTRMARTSPAGGGVYRG